MILHGVATLLGHLWQSLDLAAFRQGWVGCGRPFGPAQGGCRHGAEVHALFVPYRRRAAMPYNTFELRNSTVGWSLRDALPARLPACPPARLPACPPARLPACPPARLPACPPARLPACPPARLPACPPARLPASALPGASLGRADVRTGVWPYLAVRPRYAAGAAQWMRGRIGRGADSGAGCMWWPGRAGRCLLLLPLSARMRGAAGLR